MAGRFDLVEEPALAAAPIVLLGLPRLDGPGQHAEKLIAQQIGFAGIEAIESPRPDQRLGAAGAHVPGRDPFEEVVQAQERAIQLACLDDRLDGLEPDPLDRSPTQSGSSPRWRPENRHAPR